MASKQGHRLKTSNATKRSPNVFERLSSTPNNSKKNDIMESIKTTGSRVNQTSVIANKQRTILKSQRQKKTAITKKKDSDSASDDIPSAKCLLETVPETFNKDDQEEQVIIKEIIAVSRSKEDTSNSSCVEESSISSDGSYYSACAESPFNKSIPPTGASLNHKLNTRTKRDARKLSRTLSSTTKDDNLVVFKENKDDIKEPNDDKLGAKEECKEGITDEDKDVCENDSEDEEFYKVKVLTRLVSYENSTLVIRNTTKPTDESAASSGHECASSESSLEENILTTDFNPSGGEEIYSVPSTSAVEVPVPYPDFEVVPSVDSFDELHHDEESEQCLQNSSINEKSPETSIVDDNFSRSQSMRLSFGQLVSKGRSFLSNVKNSSYLKDVKTPLEKLQNATRFSMSSMVASVISQPEVNHRLVYNSDGGHTNRVVNKVEWDTFDHYKEPFMPDNTSPDCAITTKGNDKYESEPPIISEEKSSFGFKDAESCRVEGSHSEMTSSSNGVDFQNYFSPCYCSGNYSETFNASSSGSKNVENCTCLQDFELPSDIKEILDSDHARMWWTITGNFGNILPIDWSKSFTRQKFLPVLNLNEAKKLGENISSTTPSPRTDDDEVAEDLDLHQLIVSHTETQEPVKSAEQVIKEIDDIMQEGSSSEDECSSSKDGYPHLRKLPPPIYHDKLKELSVNELNDSLMELEIVIRQYSETLISQLALRDELEYEKELKNNFISLLLQVQNKRRNLSSMDKNKKLSGPNGIDAKYLTTVIPYDVGHGPPSNQTLQILIKILTAINDDSPTVPTLLTDYILKVLCPS